MTEEQQKEIKQALLGRTVLAEDGRITTLEPGFHLSAGIGDGAGAVRFFGVMKKRRCYDTKMSRQKVFKAAETAMQNIGRGLLLREQPETPACLIRYLLTRPVVLTFEYEDDIPVLTGWTGRGLTGFISLRRAMYAFTDELPEGITVSETAPPEEEKQEKPKKEKKRKKKDKEEPEAVAEILPEAENQPVEEQTDDKEENIQ